MESFNSMQGAGGFISILQENNSFRELVGKVSSKEELRGFLARSGFKFDEYQLIQAMTELFEEEREKQTRQRCLLCDDCYLELL